MASAMRGRWQSSVIVTVGMVALFSCDPFPAQYSLGVTEDAAGRQVITYLGCQGESVETVQLVIAVGHPGGTDDTVLWSVRSTTPTADVQLTVGEPPPPNFIETVAPNGDQLPPTKQLTAIVSSSRVTGVAQPFTVRSLAVGKFVTSSGVLSSFDFRRLAATSCTT